MAVRWGVVVLAAGAGKRMGGVPKSLITVDGVPLLRQLLEYTNALQPAATVLVLGHHAAAIRQAVQRWPLDAPTTFLENDAPGEYPASSLRLGLRALLALPTPVGAVMVLLADQALLTADDVQEASRRYAQRGQQRIVWPVHAAVPGHPVMLEASTARAWLAQQGAGLRVWAQQTPSQVATWNPGHMRYTTDLDTPDDVARLASETGKMWALPASETQNSSQNRL